MAFRIAYKLTALSTSVWMLLTGTAMGKVKQHDFVELVVEAPVIACGVMILQEGNSLLEVKEVLKGTCPQELEIRVSSWPGMRLPSFQTGEEVTLFLDSVDAQGSAALFGYGDQGKWPRSSDDTTYPGILAVARHDEVDSLVTAIIGVNSLTETDARFRELESWFESSNEKLALLALEYVLGPHAWNDSPLTPETSHEVAASRFIHLRRASIAALPLTNNESVAIRVLATRLIRYAPPDLALPALIKQITDSNPRIRWATQTVLETLAEELKGDRELRYNPAEPIGRLMEVQDRWRAWWSQFEARHRSPRDE